MTSDEAHALHLLHGDEKHPGNLFAVGLIMLLLASVAVLGRLYTRIFVTRNIGIDDGFIVLALLTIVGSAVTYHEGKSRPFLHTTCHMCLTNVPQSKDGERDTMPPPLSPRKSSTSSTPSGQCFGATADV